MTVREGEDALICGYLEVIVVKIHFRAIVVPRHHVPFVLEVVGQELLVLRVYQRVHEVGSPVELGIASEEGIDFGWAGAGAAEVSCIVALGNCDIQ